ncbi:MAG: pyridine nucleotide-disulfide oxidoreductase [Desulfobacteraceae bacterium]|nr:pyridine nucleotide-disulfide oxidoreductase [Desulfobacteraceae bacterium]
MNFLIIGGDAAGMSAASRAKRNQPDLTVTVLEQTEDVSYSACGMPYNIADTKRDMNDLVVREARVFREKQGIQVLTGHTAQTLHLKRKTVSGKKRDGTGFELPYDKILIATGARPIQPDIPGHDLPGVLYLKNLEQGRNIKAFLQTHPVKKAVILGMGYIALEMCEAFRERDIQVSMIKPRETFLPWMARDLAEMVKEELTSRGVTLYSGSRVTEIRGIETGGLQVVYSEGSLDADLILVATGVVPNSEIAAGAGLELGPGKSIAVDRSLRTSAPDIYAAGDCSDAYHVVTGEKTWIPLALRANRAGWAVADAICGEDVTLEGVAGTAVFKVFDLEVARTGLGMEEAKQAGFDPEEEIIHSRSRAHAHPGSETIRVQMVGDKTTGRLLGVQMVGKEGVAHRINAPAVALSSGMTVARFSQCDLAYAPPFGPVWDPVLTAANQWMKKQQQPLDTVP